MEMITVLCCIQARMGSERLLGKVMKTICGKPLIVHIIDRLKLCSRIDKIVLATSKGTKNDILEKTARKQGIEVLRGPEHNVLRRFYEVLRVYKPAHVVRVCADNPLIDPVEVDRVIAHHIRKKADYSFNHIPAMGNNYPDGVGAEVFKTSVLEDLVERKKTSRAEREHINEYIWNHLNQYHVETVKAPLEIAYPQYRLDVNTGEDLKFVRRIYRRLYRGNYFSTRAVIEYLKKEELKVA